MASLLTVSTSIGADLVAHPVSQFSTASSTQMSVSWQSHSPPLEQTFSFGRPQNSPDARAPSGSDRSQQHTNSNPSLDPRWGTSVYPSWNSYGADGVSQREAHHDAPQSAWFQEGPPQYGGLPGYGDPTAPQAAADHRASPYPADSGQEEPKTFGFPSRRPHSSTGTSNEVPSQDRSFDYGSSQLRDSHPSDQVDTAPPAQRPTSAGPSLGDVDSSSEPLDFLDSVDLSSLASTGSTFLRRALPILGGLFVAQQALQSASEATKFAANTALHPLHLPLAVSEQVASAGTSVVSGAVGLAARGAANVLLGTAKTAPSVAWTVTKFGRASPATSSNPLRRHVYRRERMENTPVV